MAEKKMTFEVSIRRLEEIVGALERGDRSLDEALALFEEGTKLMKQCSTLLDKAEQKVLKVTEQADGTLTESEFPPPEGE